MTETISLAISPMGKPRMTQRDVWKQRPVVLRYRDFCDKVRDQLPLFELPSELHLTFFVEMPKSWSKKRRAESIGKPHDAKPDIDNLAKAFMDAFKTEDKHVYKLVAEKYWSETGSIEVTRKVGEK